MGWVLGGWTRGDGRTRDSRRPSKKSRPRAGLGVLPRRGILRTWHGLTCKESPEQASPGAEKNLPLAFLGMSVFFWEGWGPGSRLLKTKAVMLGWKDRAGVALGAGGETLTSGQMGPERVWGAGCSPERLPRACLNQETGCVQAVPGEQGQQTVSQQLTMCLPCPTISLNTSWIPNQSHTCYVERKANIEQYRTSNSEPNPNNHTACVLGQGMGRPDGGKMDK